MFCRFSFLTYTFLPPSVSVRIKPNRRLRHHRNAAPFMQRGNQFDRCSVRTNLEGWGDLPIGFCRGNAIVELSSVRPCAPRTSCDTERRATDPTPGASHPALHASCLTPHACEPTARPRLPSPGLRSATPDARLSRCDRERSAASRRRWSQSVCCEALCWRCSGGDSRHLC